MECVGINLHYAPVSLSSFCFCEYIDYQQEFPVSWLFSCFTLVFICMHVSMSVSLNEHTSTVQICVCDCIICVSQVHESLWEHLCVSVFRVCVCIGCMCEFEAPLGVLDHTCGYVCVFSVCV